MNDDIKMNLCVLYDLSAFCDFKSLIKSFSCTFTLKLFIYTTRLTSVFYRMYNLSPPESDTCWGISRKFS